MHDWGELHLPPKHGGGVLPDHCRADERRAMRASSARPPNDLGSPKQNLSRAVFEC